MASDVKQDDLPDLLRALIDAPFSPCLNALSSSAIESVERAADKTALAWGAGLAPSTGPGSRRLDQLGHGAEIALAHFTAHMLAHETPAIRPFLHRPLRRADPMSFASLVAALDAPTKVTETPGGVAACEWLAVTTLEAPILRLYVRVEVDQNFLALDERAMLADVAAGWIIG